MPLFTRSHYEYLAKFIRFEIELAVECHDTNRKAVLQGFARLLARKFEQGSNPKFDRARFLKAAGEDL